MSRLPNVGADGNAWGTILNDFLSQAHNADGSIKNLYVNVKDPAYGAKGDGKTVTDGAITTGTPTLTSATAVFTAADVGKLVTVIGAGASAANLATSISAYVNATTVTLAANAGTTVSAANVLYATDDTAAIVAAIAALPTTTLYATPPSGGASAVYHYGTLFFPAGSYRIGTSSDIGNIGPLVSLIGLGHNTTKLYYCGSGDCLRLFNAINPTSLTFDTLAGWAAKIDGFLIDGTFAAAGGRGLHYGDTEGGVLGPDLFIFNFSGAGSIGLYLDNSVSWTESIYGRVVLYNCTSCVVFDVTSGSANISHGKNDYYFKVYCFANQNGIVLQNGAFFYQGSLRVVGNMIKSGSAQTNAMLTITGRQGVSGQWTQITYAHLDMLTEADGAGANAPQTIKFGDVSNNAIYNCTGILSFLSGWTLSNWSVANSFAAGNFTFTGEVFGDTNLAPSVSAGVVTMGATIYGASLGFANGGMPLSQGDFFPLTLSQNMTVTLQNNTAGPQRKTFLFKQAASGGPFTVTWPKPGSPTLSLPAIYWAGGTAPTMTATASATDKYELVTLDGIHWYGTATQNLS